MSLSPKRLAMRDQAMAEAGADLDALLQWALDKLEQGDNLDDVTDKLIQGLLDNPDWDKLLLSTVVGMAVSRLSGQQLGGAR